MYQRTILIYFVFLICIQCSFVSIAQNNAPLNWIVSLKPASPFLNSHFHLLSLTEDQVNQLIVAENNLTSGKLQPNAVELYSVLGSYYESISNYDKALKYLFLAEKLTDNSTVEWNVFAKNYIGYVYWHKSQYDSALYYHNNALALIQQSKITSSNFAFNSLMLGNDYYDMGDYIKTSEYYFESLAQFEKLNDTVGQIMALNRLSKLYSKLNDLESSMNHVLKAKKLNKTINHIRELGNTYNCLGNIYIDKGALDSALHYFSHTFHYFKLSGDIIGQSISCINLGDTYNSLSKEKNASFHFLDSSYFYYEKSYILNSIVANKFGMIYGIWGMADIEFRQLDYENALNNYRKALQISLLINAKSEEYNLYWKMFTVFDAKNNIDSSYHYLKKFVEVKHSLENQEQTKELLRQESKYEIEKRISEQKAEMEREKLIELEKNKWKNYLIIGVVFVALLLLYLVFNTIKKLKIIAQKNKLINSINHELSMQNGEILDSINYAKRIQNAILPSDRVLKETLTNSFVLYLPKDIVAGDFYWLNTSPVPPPMDTTPNPPPLEGVKGEVVYLAAADCTGHGVPGAMVSVICNNGLNRSLREYGITDPGKILDKTKEIVIEEFAKSDEEVRDGMDIALISLNKETLELQYAGANNPLWIFRKNTIGETELIEVKPDNHPIGKYEISSAFQTKIFQLYPDDTFYIFTDGYQDQFGGEKGKKFKSAAMKRLLMSIQKLNMDTQKDFIFKAFEDWKGDLEQIDDICIIGVRL